jgi:hypothetical protein
MKHIHFIKKNKPETKMSNTQITSSNNKPWYLKSIPFNNKCSGLRVPVCIKFKNLYPKDTTNTTCTTIDEPTETQGGSSSGFDVTDRNVKPECKTIWFETIDLHCMPIEKIRVFWAPQSRCFIVKSKSNFLQCDTQEERLECGLTSSQENRSQLMQYIRLNKEKNQYQLKRIICLPEYVCAKNIRVTIDERANYLVIKAKVEKNQEMCNEKQCCGLERECYTIGEEERLHRFCQPTQLLTTFEALIKRDPQNSNSTTFVPEFKLITETQEYFYASQIIRRQLKEIKYNSFPSLLKSPRFVKNEKNQEWFLRIVFRLSQRIYRQRDLHVKISDEKKRLILLEGQSEIRNEKYGFINVHEIRHEFALPDLVDVSKIHSEYHENAGFVQIDIPCIREKMTQIYHDEQTTSVRKH